MIVVAALLVVVGATPARAAIFFSFFKLTDSSNPDVGDQLKVRVSDVGSNLVDFKFRNDVGVDSSITDIYFDDDTLLDIGSITDSGVGVDFPNDGATPGNLSGANLANPRFVSSFSADSSNPVVSNGVDAASEWVTITFSLLNGQTYADTLAALADSSLRIGLRVQAIGGPTGGGDSYINNAVPEPSAILVWAVLGLAGYGSHRLRRRRRSVT